MRYTFTMGGPIPGGVLAILETEDRLPLVGETVRWRDKLFVGIDDSHAVFVGPLEIQPRELTGELVGCWEPDPVAGLKWVDHKERAT